MATEQLFEEIRKSIVEMDEERLAELTREIGSRDIDPVEAIERAFTPAIKEVGALFERGQLFLPELVRAGHMVKETVDILQSGIPKEERPSAGTFLIGTVEGDIHNIGKDLVITMLANRGFEVVDIGVNVPAAKFVDEAMAVDADIIGASCLLTMTLPELEKIVAELEKRGIRKRFKLMVGGAAVDPNMMDEIGADGTGADLKEAVDVAIELIEAARFES